VRGNPERGERIRPHPKRLERGWELDRKDHRGSMLGQQVVIMDGRRTGVGVSWRDVTRRVRRRPGGPSLLKGPPPRVRVPCRR
jgi:hypothetical protein